MKNKIFTYETLGTLLIVLSFIIGDKIPSSMELRWTIITLVFVWGLIKRVERIEKKLDELK